VIPKISVTSTLRDKTRPRRPAMRRSVWPVPRPVWLVPPERFEVLQAQEKSKAEF
jgi:hypothetical protein